MCWLGDTYFITLTCGPLDYAEFAAFGLTNADPAAAAVAACHWATRCFRRDPGMAGQEAVLLRRLRDILGDPFDPVPLDPGWLRPPVSSLAAAIYRGQRFEDLPVLADALEEAGCADPRLLDHCRRRGTHARGCWLLDRLTGRS
jgi:hypothetical protein